MTVTINLLWRHNPASCTYFIEWRFSCQSNNNKIRTDMSKRKCEPSQAEHGVPVGKTKGKKDKKEKTYDDIEHDRYWQALKDHRASSSSGEELVIPTKVPLYSVNMEWMRGHQEDTTLALCWKLSEANEIAEVEHAERGGENFDNDQNDDPFGLGVYRPERKRGMFSCMIPEGGDTCMISVDQIQSTHMLRFCPKRRMLNAIEWKDASLHRLLVQFDAPIEAVREGLMRIVHDEQLSTEEWTTRLQQGERAL